MLWLSEAGAEMLRAARLQKEGGREEREGGRERREGGRGGREREDRMLTYADVC